MTQCRSNAMRFFFSLFSLVFLVSCATEINTAYIDSMNYYIGKRESVLIDGMGVPDKVYKMENGPKLVTYTKVTERTLGGGTGFGVSSCAGHFNNFGIGGCMGSYPAARIQTYFCDITFEIQRGQVTNWRQQGNDCPRIR